jgi:hypothetical protein
MQRTKLFTEEWEIDTALARFGATRAELAEAAQLTFAARSDSVPSDPLSGPGQLSYIYGNRYVRRVFCPKGWLIDRHENVESVRPPDSGMRIVFQNVDLACSVLHSPKAISGKGSAAERMVSNGQGRLFDMPEVYRKPKAGELNLAVWYFCMSFADDQFSAELSLPASIKGDNFAGFIERIFIVNGAGDDGSRIPRSDGEPPVELEPVVLRK